MNVGLRYHGRNLWGTLAFVLEVLMERHWKKQIMHLMKCHPNFLDMQTGLGFLLYSKCMSTVEKNPTTREQVSEPGSTQLGS